MKVGITSLGCARNLVDSELILGSLKEASFKIVDAESGPDVLIVNTCSFIQAAREEAIEAILDAVRLKKEGRIGHLVVCGCLPQMYGEDLLKKMPEIDLVLGTSDYPKISALLKDILRKKASLASVSRKLSYLADESAPRLLLTPGHYAYVKISEGCSNSCSYCVIGRLRGSHRSRPMGSILEEIKGLSRGGALKEVNLIGQDTTAFGADIYGRMALGKLLRKICALRNSIRWIRLLYTHPAHYTDELISTIRGEERIARYLDLPVQHIDDGILRRMNRKTTKKDITGLIEKLRKRIPGIILRTSVIVGFPGETDEIFKRLLKFMRETRFERLGAFIYSREDDTKAAAFSGQVPRKVKEERFDELMRLQQGISRELNEACLGKEFDCLIDEKEGGERDRFAGRTEGDAPEIDGTVDVSGRGIKVGEFCRVKITDAFEYDLTGQALRRGRSP